MSEEKKPNEDNEKAEAKTSISSTQKKGAVVAVCGALLFGGASIMDSVGKDKVDDFLSELNDEDINVQVDSVDVGLFGGVTLEDVTVKQRIGVSYAIESIELSHRYFNNEIPTNFEFSINSLVVDIHEETIDNEMIAALNFKDGVEINCEGSYKIGLTGGIEVEYSQKMDNVGEFNLDFSGDNWSDLVKSANNLLDIQSGESNIEGKQQAEEELAEYLQKATVKEFILTFKDDGITEEVIEFLSKRKGISEEEYKANISSFIDQMYGFVAGSMSQTKKEQHDGIKAALKGFIDSPDELELNIDFGEELSVANVQRNPVKSVMQNASVTLKTKIE